MRNLKIKDCQKMIFNLEESKGFGHRIQDKILWIGEEYGELIHAFKHNDKKAMIEETTDIFFFIGSLWENLGVDGEKEFIRKMKKNMKRKPVHDDKEMHFDA